MGDYVVAAACKEPVTGFIAVGARHWDKIMRRQKEAFDRAYGISNIEWEQGFINQFGEFLTRKEALQVAKESGQPLDMERNGTKT